MGHFSPKIRPLLTEVSYHFKSCPFWAGLGAEGGGQAPALQLGFLCACRCVLGVCGRLHVCVFVARVSYSRKNDHPGNLNGGKKCAKNTQGGG